MVSESENRVNPTDGADIEPTVVLPEQSPWARPVTGADWPAPDASTWVSPSPPEQPAAAGPSADHPGASYPTWTGQASSPPGQYPPADPYQQNYPAGGYPSAAYPQGPYQQAYYQGHYQQPPGYYTPQHYYQPVPPPKKKWPLAMVAVLTAFLLAVAGSAWVGHSLQGAQSSPVITIDPQPEQSAPVATGEPEQNQGTTTSNAVAAAQSAGVVLIEAETSSGVGAGTGMILTADGQVLTNYHVVAGSEKVSATIADTGDTYVATVVGFDQSRDVALLQLKDARGLTTVTIDDDPVQVGDQVAAVGNAEGGGELVKAPGKVTATDQDLTVSSDSPWGNTEDLSGLIETNAAAVPGDSGGPMFDAENEVLGMTTAGSTRERTSYAVPIQTALAVIDQIRDGHDAGTVRVGPAGFLGVKVAESERGSGKTITEVVAGSPAEQAGVTSGSTLTKVGDTRITASTNLATVIRSLEPGQRVTIEWTTPKGSPKSATVTLGSSPVN